MRISRRVGLTQTSLPQLTHLSTGTGDLGNVPCGQVCVRALNELLCEPFMRLIISGVFFL